MVKNHALKVDARARKATTGETLHEAIRAVADTYSNITVRLSKTIKFEMTGDVPNLLITGGSRVGKTTLVKKVLSHLDAFEGQVIVLTDNPRDFDDHAGRKNFTFARHSPIVLKELSNQACNPLSPDFSPVLLVVENLSWLSDESNIYLQMIAQWGSSRGINIIATSNSTANVPSTIKSRTHHVSIERGGLALFDYTTCFSIHESETAIDSSPSAFRIGNGASWEATEGNLHINGVPGSGKTVLAQDIAKQALLKGAEVVVLCGDSDREGWQERFGSMVTVHSLHNNGQELIEILAKKNKGSRPQYVIIDGLDVPEKMTVEDAFSVALILNFIKGKFLPVIFTSVRFNDMFTKLFESTIVLKQSSNTELCGGTFDLASKGHKEWVLSSFGSGVGIIFPSRQGQINGDTTKFIACEYTP